MKVCVFIFCVLTLSVIDIGSFAQQTAYNYSKCNSSQILITSTLTCQSCPTNMRPSPNQNIPTYCVCAKGYYANINQTCQQAYSGTSCTETQYIPIINRDGQYDTIPAVCSNCAANAYSNINGTGCVPCPVNMNYSSGEGCICSNTAFIKTQIGCFDKSLTSSLNLGQSNSIYYEELKYLLPGCFAFNDILSCSYLVNLCIYSHLQDTPECNFFDQQAAYSSFIFPTQAEIGFYLSPGTFTKQSALSFKLISYLPTGNYVGEKSLQLPDIFRCGLPLNNSVALQIGDNIKVTCSFNFDYLVKKMSTFTYKNYLYELLIQGEGQIFHHIPVYPNSGTKACKRYYLQNTYSSSTSISVMTSLTISLELNTTGHLTNPQLFPTYTSLSIQNGQINPTSQKSQQITYKIQFTYDLSTFWTGSLIVFIVVNVLVLIQSIIRSYIGYLNRQSPLSFFFYFAKFWSLWMFYFLLVISGYWFLFCKTTQELYIFVPTTTDFYAAFYVIAAVMVFFRIITVIFQKNQKLNIEVFMINWEKGHFRNSWRQIFIVNSLAQFYTYRTISLFYMLLIVMFFLVGLSWEKHAAQVTHTTLANIYSVNPINRVFLYFLGCAIFLAVGVIFKILRRLSVIQWPYPFEDFVDYCNVTNISFFFMRKNSPEAYYIHASISDRTEVTFKQVNEAIRKGLNKNRTVTTQASFMDHQRMYIVFLCKDLEDKFNNMIKKLDQEKDQSINITSHSQKSIKAKGKHYLNPRQEFLEKKLKPHLENISRQGSNKTKTFFQSTFKIPPVDLRDPANSLKTRNQVIFDSNMDLVSEVFPNGNQFEQIHTFIIIFLGFILLTSSISIAAFLTYFVDQFLFNKWIERKCRKNLQKMTKVKEGFML